MDVSIYIDFWKKRPKDVFTSKKKSIFDINFLELKNDVDLIIFDYDDTLTSFHGDLSEKSRKLISSITQYGFSVALVSNFPPHRKNALIQNFKGHSVFLEFSGNKPNPAAYLNVLEHFQISKDRTVMIGDRVGADLYGAYLAKIKYRILVEPFSNLYGGKRPNIFYRILRSLEKKLI